MYNMPRSDVRSEPEFSFWTRGRKKNEHAEQLYSTHSWESNQPVDRSSPILHRGFTGNVINSEKFCDRSKGLDFMGTQSLHVVGKRSRPQHSA